jgi:hypothetical protein
MKLACFYKFIRLLFIFKGFSPFYCKLKVLSLKISTLFGMVSFWIYSKIHIFSVLRQQLFISRLFSFRPILIRVGWLKSFLSAIQKMILVGAAHNRPKFILQLDFEFILFFNWKRRFLFCFYDSTLYHWTMVLDVIHFQNATIHRSFILREITICK